MIAGVDSRAMVRRLGRGALMPVAALLVHQLRYMLAFGGHAGVELARQGHAYLHSLVPWIVLLIGVAVGAFLWALGRTLGGQRSLFALHALARCAVDCVLRLSGRDLRRAGAARRAVRDRASSWARRDLWVRRLVGGTGGGVCRARAGDDLPRRPLGARRNCRTPALAGEASTRSPRACAAVAGCCAPRARPAG